MRAPVITEIMQGRGLAEYETQVISVTDPPFRARGNNLTDDSAAIQNAFDAVPAGSRIVFPPGTYRANNLNVEKQLSLLGYGAVIANNSLVGNPTFKLGFAAGQTKFILMKGFKLSKVPGATTGEFIKGDKIEQTILADMELNGSDAQGIHILNNSYMNWMRNLWITDCTGTGIYLNNPAGTDYVNANWIDHCTITLNTSYAIYILNCNFNIIKNCVLEGNSRHVILSGGVSNTIRDCYMEAQGSGDRFILVDADEKYSRIIDNHFGTPEDPFYCIDLQSCQDITLENNSYDGPGNFITTQAATLRPLLLNNIAPNAAIFMGGVSPTNPLIQRQPMQITYGTAAPTTGTWAIGDICKNRTPDVGGFADWICIGAGTPGTWRAKKSLLGIGTLADVATPSVVNFDTWKTGGSTAITNFLDGLVAKTITIIALHAITITNNANIFLDGDANFDMTVSDTLTLVRSSDGNWYEVGRCNR